MTRDELQKIRERSVDGLLYVHGVKNGIILSIEERDALCALAERALQSVPLKTSLQGWRDDPAP